MGFANASTAVLCASDRGRARSEAQAIKALPRCPKCKGKFTLEKAACARLADTDLVYGGDLGHVDAVCFVCRIGVNVKGNSRYTGEKHIKTAPASKVAYLRARKYFGLRGLYLFYGNPQHNAFLSYEKHLTGITNNVRLRGGSVQERICLSFEV